MEKIVAILVSLLAGLISIHQLLFFLEHYCLPSNHKQVFSISKASNMRKSVQKETSVKVSGKTRKNRNGKRTSQCVRKTSWSFVMNYDHTYKTHHKYEIPCWSGKTSCSNTLLLIRWGKILKDSKCIWTIVINLYCSEISMCNYYTSGETDVSGHRHKEDCVSIKMNLNEDICKCPNLRQHVFISVFDCHGGKEATKFCWKQLWDVTPWVVYFKYRSTLNF